jgi:molybdopterin molybdotransferase
VVPQELARPDGQGRVAFSGTVRPGQWIRPAGSDLARGSEILPPGTALRAQHLAIAAAVGVGSLAVRRAPRVALLATGDELVEPGDALRPGGMYNSNRFQLAELLRVIGCRVLDLGQVPDRADAVEQALAGAAAQSELVLSSGGVSVGEEDHVRAAVERLGRIDMWRVAMKPGKPLAHGSIAGTPFFGVPGNPVSCLVSYLLFVRPFILRALGARQVLPQALRLPAAFTRSGDPERREFLRVRLDAQGGLELHPQQGPSQLGALAASDGLAEVPAGVQVAPGAMLVYHSLAALSGPP